MRHLFRSYSDEKKLRRMYKNWVASQIETLSIEELVQTDSVERANNYASLLKSPIELRPSGTVWKIIGFIFFSLCFCIVITLFYWRIGSAALQLNAVVSEFSFVPNASQSVLMPAPIDAIEVDGYTSLSKSGYTDNILNLQSTEEDKVSVQSMIIEPDVDVRVVWTASNLSLELVELSGASSGVLTLTLQDGDNSFPNRIDVVLSSFVSIKIWPSPTAPLVPDTPFDVKQFRSISQVGVEEPKSTMRLGDVAFYDTSLVKKVGMLDLLQIRSDGDGKLLLVDLEASPSTARVSLSGQASVVLGGVSGSDNLMPSLFNWWEGKPAIVVILGATWMLFITLRGFISR